MINKINNDKKVKVLQIPTRLRFEDVIPFDSRIEFNEEIMIYL